MNKHTHKKSKCITAATALTVTALQAPAAHAYNYATHSRIAELAVRAMRAEEVDTPTPPAGEEALFAQYLAAVRAAPARLGLLHTGLPSQQDAGSAGLIPGLGSTESYPLSLFGADVCRFQPSESRDLTKIGSFQIKELNYFPEEFAKPCGLKVPSSDTAREDSRADSNQSDRADANRVMELVMGWHAGSVDDHLSDSVLWVRPTAVGLAGLFTDAASLAFEVGVGAILLPFVCLGEAIFGDGCDVGDSFAFARQYNPVDFIEGLVPGIGDIRSDSYTGLWHFEDVGASINRFNDTRGMWYPGAGPSHPGAIDVVISAGAEITGLSLDALASDGDNQYGQYDRVGRLFPEWQAHTIGTLEFSPLHNLARFGWDRFVNGGAQDASGLAWPLHAIGDACEPQHVVGSTGWGHRPYEEAIEHQSDRFLPRNRLQSDGTAEAGAAKDQLTRILSTTGYRWWKQFHNDQDMAKLIHDLAQDTRSQVAATGDWPYIDGASTKWQLDNSGGEDDLANALFPASGGHAVDAQKLLESAVGAAIAVLTEAAGKVPNIARTNIDCPSGQVFSVTTVPLPIFPGILGVFPDQHATVGGCTSTPTFPPPPVVPSAQPLFTPPLAPDAGTDAGTGCTGTPCETAGDCPGPDFICSSGCCLRSVIR